MFYVYIYKNKINSGKKITSRKKNWLKISSKVADGEDGEQVQWLQDHWSLLPDPKLLYFLNFFGQTL